MLMKVLPPNENTATYTFAAAKWFQIIVKTNQKQRIKPKPTRENKTKQNKQQQKPLKKKQTKNERKK